MSSEALRLADRITPETDWYEFDQVTWCKAAAKELRTQAARIAELESRVHTCGPTCSKAGCINRRVTAERDTLRAEVEMLRPNAERYLYLRDVAWREGLLVYFDHRYHNDEWDEKIDTARKATP